jgi:acyl-CoA synthetase (AMP-forming)/AMP-acid ligase II
MPNLFQQVQYHAQHRPEAVALWQPDGAASWTSTTFSELAMSARHFAAAFHRQPGSESVILPMYLSKSADCVAAMIGAIGAGKAFAYLNKKLRVAQINAILRDSSAKLGLMDGFGAMNLRTGLVADSPITRTHWWVLRGNHFLSVHEKAIDKMRTLGCRLNYWPIDENGGHDIPTLNDEPQRPGCCLFTSGSTGTPKGVLIAESDLRARANAEIRWFGLSPNDVLLSILPFSFDVGLNQLLSAMTVGCSLVLLDSWLPTDIHKAVAEFKVTGISGVPAIWLDMMNANRYFDTTDEHASLRYITLSGGDLSQQHLEQLPKLAPHVGIFKTYGQTEAFRATSLRPEEFNTKLTSVGRPFEGVNVYIVRQDGEKSEVNEVGEIVHTGLGIMLGYLDGHDPQKKLRPNPFQSEHDDSPVAIFTGDTGYIDEDGYLFLQGRADSMLKVAGNRIYPKEIINQILTLGSVQEAEIVGIKTDTDTHLFAFVVLTDGADMTSMQILRQLTTQLPSYMVPQEVIIVTSIPRTASGKTDYPTLNNWARERVEH